MGGKGGAGRRWLLWGVWLGALVVLLALPSLAGSMWDAEAEGPIRRYFIAADEVDWDYAPAGKDQITGEPFGEDARVFVEGGAERIGRVYRKALYREYTDGTFTTLKPVAPEWQHLGLLGPLIRAEVGDTIVIEFRNNTTIPASMHPHGVYYDKNAEGAPYADSSGSGNKRDDAVPPGSAYTYVWEVRERSGPGPGDGSSVLWMYHSHTDEAADTNTGLVGPLIITAKGKARPDGSPKDVDRELITLFHTFDENRSHYLEANIDRFAPDPATMHRAYTERYGEFHRSNLKNAINGYLYGNLPELTTRVGEKVRWYVMALGSSYDIHTPHWHGGTLLMFGPHMGMRTDMAEVFPGSMKILDMEPDNPGVWLFHCHVDDHFEGGMSALYTVTR